MRYALLRYKGLLAVAALFGLLVSIADVGTAALLQVAVDAVSAGDRPLFWRLVLLSAIYLAVLGLLVYAHASMGKRLVCRVSAYYRQQIYQGIQRRNTQDFSAQSTADYLSALTNDSRLLEENYIQPMLDTLQYGAMFIASLALLVFYSPVITGVLTVCMVGMYLAPSLIGRSLQGRQERYSLRLAAFTGKLKDLLGGHAVIHSFHMQKWAAGEFSGENQEMAGAKLSADRLLALSGSVSNILAALTQFTVIFMAGFFVMTGRFTMGTLMGVTLLSGNFIVPILNVMESYPKIKGVRPVIQKLDALAQYEDTAFTGTGVPVFKDSISLRGLTFGYADREPVLEGVDAVFRKGGKYAVTGPSGCGKTTMIRLLTGSYAGYSGSIQLDEVELRELDISDYFSLFSVIHQQVFLFDRDIRMNIGLCGEHSEDEWERALAISGVAKFLPALPGGLDTPVGENGCNLSGGQRQRIAVARALLHRAPVLIMDEGTSAVDMQTAYDIERSLLEVDELTLVTITHNMEAELLGLYDEILFMADGQVVQRGGLTELLQAGGPFSKFYTLQA